MCGHMIKDTTSPIQKPTRPIQKPAPPPGPGWKTYTDNHEIWFYYEGELGKWWCDVKRHAWPYDTDDERE